MKMISGTDTAGALYSSNPNLFASHFVVVPWIIIVVSTAINVTDAIIRLPGAFMPISKPASAAGITPVSLVQHMKSISLKLHLARRSGNVALGCLQTDAVFHHPTFA